jgi:hypothetical protein
VSYRNAVRQTVLELRAHGHDATTVLERIEQHGDDGPLAAATAMHLRGAYDHARAIYDSVLRANPGCSDCVGISGVMAARMGDTAAAGARLAELAARSAEEPHLYGRGLAWQARIANALGRRESAAGYLVSAFAAGYRLDAMLHADPSLAGVDAESLYRERSRQAR